MFSDKTVSLLLNIFTVSCQGIKVLPSFLSADLYFTNRFSLHKYLKSSLWRSMRMMVLIIFIVKILSCEEHLTWKVYICQELDVCSLRWSLEAHFIVRREKKVRIALEIGFLFAVIVKKAEDNSLRESWVMSPPQVFEMLHSDKDVHNWALESQWEDSSLENEDVDRIPFLQSGLCSGEWRGFSPPARIRSY